MDTQKGTVVLLVIVFGLAGRAFAADDTLYRQQMRSFRKMSNEYNRLEKEAAAVQEEIMKRLARYHELNTEVERLEEVVSRYKNHARALVTQIADKQARIAALSAESQALKQQYWQTQQGYGKMQADQKRLALDRENLYAGISEMKSQKAEYDRKIDYFSTRKERLQLDAKQVLRIIDQLKEEYENKRVPLEQ